VRRALFCGGVSEHAAVPCIHKKVRGRVFVGSMNRKFAVSGKLMVVRVGGGGTHAAKRPFVPQGKQGNGRP
jgi:hypothetical protein